MAAPATIVIAKLLQPETEESLTRGTVHLEVEKTATNVIEAAANGAADGVKLSLNVGGMLLAFVALITMINFPLGWVGQVTGIEGLIGETLTLSIILGYILSPLAWIIGIPWDEAVLVGGLIGEKISTQSVLISTYALCGFANFSSIAIQLGGIGGLAPNRRPDIARLGLRAVLGGTLATMMTATIAGVLTSIAG
jgi:CNT family concentrative nucleoside transporter